MIEVDNMYVDLRTDSIGQSITLLRASPKWNSEKHRLKIHLMDLLKSHNYERIAGTRQQFRMTGGIGFSYLYNVPERKRGRFKPFAGQLIRMVYVDSAKNYLEISVGQVPIDQRGVSYRSLAPTTSAIEFDPRTVYL